MAETVLDEARRLVEAHAARDYGHPTKNFRDIAKIWTMVLGCPVTAYDVGLMMIGLKLARLANSRKRDSIVDIAGYAYTLELLEKEPLWPKPPRTKPSSSGPTQ